MTTAPCWYTAEGQGDIEENVTRSAAATPPSSSRHCPVSHHLQSNPPSRPRSVCEALAALSLDVVPPSTASPLGSMRSSALAGETQQMDIDTPPPALPPPLPVIAKLWKRIPDDPVGGSMSKRAIADKLRLIGQQGWLSDESIFLTLLLQLNDFPQAPGVTLQTLVLCDGSVIRFMQDMLKQHGTTKMTTSVRKYLFQTSLVHSGAPLREMAPEDYVFDFDRVLVPFNLLDNHWALMMLCLDRVDGEIHIKLHIIDSNSPFEAHTDGPDRQPQQHHLEYLAAVKQFTTPLFEFLRCEWFLFCMTTRGSAIRRCQLKTARNVGKQFVAQQTGTTACGIHVVRSIIRLLHADRLNLEANNPGPFDERQWRQDTATMMERRIREWKDF